MADENTSVEDVNSNLEQTANEGEVAAGAAAPAEAGAPGAPQDGDGSQPKAKELAKEAPAEGDDDKPKPLTRRDARIDQLLGDNRAMRGFAERTLVEKQALEAQALVIPRPEDYPNDQAYMAAVAEQAVKKAQLNILEKNAREAGERAAAAAEEAWRERTADFRARVADFDAVAHNPNLKISPIMADAIRESERGAEIAYYLGKNPNEAARIASLAPVSQATAIARLESRVSKAPAQSQTKAPPAAEQTLKGKGSAGKSLEDMSFEEYRKARGF
ncbi:MAG: hypothetical protein ACLP7P_08560 [Rhodomicrobium sp.]